MTAFIVPPTSLLLLAILGAVVIRRWPRLGLAMGGLGFAGLVALSLPVTATALLASLEQGLPVEPGSETPPEAIVVLGGDIERHAPGTSRGELGPLSLERVRTAARLWRRTHLPILVTGGTLAAGTDSVATLMARSLRDDFGVPVQWVEASAVDTWDNATRSAAILLPANISSVYLVTQAWHMRRGVQSFRRFKIAITAVPAQIDRWSRADVGDYLPHASSWLASYYALHEWIGCAYYALRA